jgi:glycosyltransferase involved in cell wall biosynthesis
MKSQKKKILLLSDDLRSTSGIATVSREFIMGTVGIYDWVQLGASVNSPSNGTVAVLDEDVRTRTGVEDAKVKIYSYGSYGDPNVLRHILNTESPDAILHFTDPRYWGWLYQMEHEIRKKIPLMYLNIWDCPPPPMYNKEAYASCDLLMAISKQTYAINHIVLSKFLGEDSYSPNRITYVPHGINQEVFKPITQESDEFSINLLAELNSVYRSDNPNKFIVFWNNRNIHRKHGGDVILAFKQFCDSIGASHSDALLLMHTHPIEQHGMDLITIAQELCSNYRVEFDPNIRTPQEMNVLYNLADITINIASSEGFGLATAESVMAGTPIVVNVTGGLQDQCGFVNPNTGVYYTADDYIDIISLNDKKDTHGAVYGDWAKPIWPSNISIQGSIPTPYIYDERASITDAADAIRYWYDIPKDVREARGEAGRQFMLRKDTMLSSVEMCSAMVRSIDTCLQEFSPRSRYEFHKV